MTKVSTREVMAYVGRDTATRTVLRDVFGHRRGLPDQPGLREVSLRRQLILLGGPHVNLNLITVGFDQLVAREEADDEIDLAIALARACFASVGLGLGRIGYYAIALAEAGGKEVITSHDEGEELTSEFMGPLFGVDVFRVVGVAMDDHATGFSPTGGDCDKAGGGMTGVVVGRGIPAALAHEVAHYLGLDHVSGSATNLMRPVHTNVETSPGLNVLWPWQGLLMKSHCFVLPGAAALAALARADHDRARTDEPAPPPPAPAASAPRPDPRELVGVVTGGAPVAVRAAALAGLRGAELLGLPAALRSLLCDEEQPVVLRLLAARALRSLATAEAGAAVLAAAGAVEPRVLAGVLDALGWIGGPAAGGVIDRFVDDARPRVRDAARFAARLHWHRLGGGAGGAGPPPAGAVERAADPDVAWRFTVEVVADETAAGCVAALDGHVRGIPLARAPMLEARWAGEPAGGRDRRAPAPPRLVVNAALLDGDRLVVPAGGSVLGFVLGRIDRAAPHHPAYVVLAARADDRGPAALEVYTMTGRLAFVGTVRWAEAGVAVEVRAVARRGGRSLVLDVAWRDGRVEVRAARLGVEVARAEPRPAPMDDRWSGDGRADRRPGPARR